MCYLKNMFLNEPVYLAILLVSVISGHLYTTHFFTQRERLNMALKTNCTFFPSFSCNLADACNHGKLHPTLFFAGFAFEKRKSPRCQNRLTLGLREERKKERPSLFTSLSLSQLKRRPHLYRTDSLSCPQCFFLSLARKEKIRKS